MFVKSIVLAIAQPSFVDLMSKHPFVGATILNSKYFNVKVKWMRSIVKRAKVCTHA